MGQSLMDMDHSFEVQAPWLMNGALNIVLTIRDRDLIGNDRYFIRFDCYPYIAPSHGKRHFGFWDVPLSMLKENRTAVACAGDAMMIGAGGDRGVKPIWRSDLEFTGHFMLHTSLWDKSRGTPEQLWVESSTHFLLPKDGRVPLDMVQLPITQRCNLQCKMCQRHFAADLDESDISREVLEPILDACPSLANVHVQGVGESLLNENICCVIDEVRKRLPAWGKVGTCTNGTLLTKETVERLLDTGPDYLFFSLDGATKAAAEAIRIGSNFDEVIDNIARCVRLRQDSRKTKPWFMANFVIMEENLDEIAPFAELMGSLGVDSVRYTHRIDYEEILAPRFEEAGKLAKRHGLAMVFPKYRRTQDVRCLHLQTMVVLLSGDVVPCCGMEPGARPWPIKTFGNVKEKSLLEIWNSGEFSEYRYQVATGDLPGSCQKCDINRGLFA
jgi:radical SAM protein with 4Fe4S-binding SPASM domain